MRLTAPAGPESNEIDWLIFLKTPPLPPPFSGTKIVSPACKVVLRTLPDHHYPEPRPTTVPWARTTKISFLLASVVGPPACLRYQPACLPVLKVMAIGL